MLRNVSTALLALGVLIAPAVAQSQNQQIRWSLQVEQGISYAEKNDKPLMVYVKGSSGGDDDIEDYERDHKRVFADPTVFALSKQFVCIQMSRSRYRDQLKEWQISPRTNLNIVFSRPNGERIGEPLAASAVASAPTLGRKMQSVLSGWANELYQQRVKPIFNKEDASIKDFRSALDLIIKFRMEAAAGDVKTLLERDKLDATTRRRALESLAVLSTKDSLDILLDLIAAGDKNAPKALLKASPAAISILLPYVGGEDAAKHVAAYTAVTKICKIPRAKPTRFWEGTNSGAMQQEIERVHELAGQYVERWQKAQP